MSLGAILGTSLMALLVARLMTALAAALVAAVLAAALFAAVLPALLVAFEPKPHRLERALRPPSVIVSVSLRKRPPAPLIFCSPPVTLEVMRCIQPSAEALIPAKELQRPPGPTSAAIPLLLPLLQRRL